MAGKSAFVEKRLSVLAAITIGVIVFSIIGVFFFIFYFFSSNIPFEEFTSKLFFFGWIIIILSVFSIWFWIEILVKQAKMGDWWWFILTLLVFQQITALIYFYTVYRKNPLH
jgi:hypothetical protein